MHGAVLSAASAEMHLSMHAVCVQINFDAHIFVSNAAAAFGLNMAVFLLIGKTSALTMNIAGVIKDWLLIALSILIFKAQASQTPHMLPDLCSVQHLLPGERLQNTFSTAGSMSFLELEKARQLEGC